MTKIVRRYRTETAWYAIIEGDDGDRREIKIRSDKEPTDADLLKLYAAICEQEAEAEMLIEVEAEDGTVIAPSKATA